MTNARITTATILAAFFALTQLTAAPPISGLSLPRFVEQANQPAEDAPSRAALSEAPAGVTARGVEYGNFPLVFEPNRGQTDPEARFLTRGSGYALFLTDSGAVVRLADAENTATVRLSFAGANARPAIKGEGLLPGLSHYYVGDDPAAWRTDIPNYERAAYRELWPGVDAIFYARQGKLEYDFVVAPGASAESIRLDFGDSDVALTPEGDLAIAAGSGVMRQIAPVIYQVVDGERRAVEGGYEIGDDGLVGFRIGEYSREYELVIDPVLSYSTFAGGSGFDIAFGVDVDAAGNAYVAGHTQSFNFPLNNQTQQAQGNSDAFVMKLSPDGSQRLYSTYWGGAFEETAWDIAVNSQGYAAVSGTTTSIANYPRQAAFQTTFGGGITDAFVISFDPNGRSQFSSPIGGMGDENGFGVAIGEDRTVYVVGEAPTSDFQPMNAPALLRQGNGDIFVLKIASSGSLIWRQVHGGTGRDGGADVDVDAAGNLYVVGGSSADYPGSSGAFQVINRGGGVDALVLSFNSSGGLRWATNLGGTDQDEAFRVDADAAGNSVVVGLTRSISFSTRNPFQAQNKGGAWDAFVTKFRPDGAAVFSTYLGGSAVDVAYGVALDGDAGDVFVAGRTASALDFPIVPGAIQSRFGGGLQDAFLVHFSPDGSELIESTFLGGTSEDEGYAAALDDLGGVYVAGVTASSDFPVTLQAAQVNLGGGSDAFVTKIGGLNCRFQVAGSNRLVSAAGISESIEIQASGSDCGWQATTDSNFIQVTSATSGAGSGIVTYRVLENTGTATRTGSILAAGKTINITQFGTGCGYLLSPSGANIVSQGGDRVAVVTASRNDCDWNAGASQSWITFPQGNTGTGSGVLRYRVASNTGERSRNASVSIGQSAIQVSQRGVECEYAVSPVDGILASEGGSGTVKVETAPTCRWTASPNAPWLSILSGASGQGNGEVRYQAAVNTGSSGVRSGDLLVAGEAVTVLQKPAQSTTSGRTITLFSTNSASSNPCSSFTASLTPNGSVQAAGASLTLDIQTGGGCSWTILRTAKAWVGLNGGQNGSGPAQRTLPISSNDQPASRSSKVVIVYGAVAGSNTTLDITQTGRTQCSFSPTPSVATVDAFGEQRDLQVSASSSECSWTAEVPGDSAFIQLAEGVAVGLGDGAVSYSVAPNNSSQQRAGRILLNSEQEIQIVQAGSPCTFSLAQPEIQIGKDAFAGSVGLTASASDCEYGAFVDPGSDWISVAVQDQRRFGSGSVGFQAQANPGSTARVGTVRIAGLTFTVRQEAGVAPPPPPPPPPVGIAPKIQQGSVVEAAQFMAMVAPGGIATVFGQDLTDVTQQAGSTPLPTEMGGASVLVNGVRAPLYFVSPGQINFQMPFEAGSTGTATLKVARNGQESQEVTVQLEPYVPAVFRNGTEPIAVRATDNSLITASNRAKPGDFLVLYLDGFGDLNNRPATGAASPSSPLATTRVAPTVRLGGVPVTVLFSGLTPGLVALGQINIQLPATLPAGNTLALEIAYGQYAAPVEQLPMETAVPPPPVNHTLDVEAGGFSPTAVAPGDAIQVSYTIASPTGYRGGVRTDFRLSTNTGGRQIFSRTDSLNANSQSFSASVTVPADMALGTYSVVVAVTALEGGASDVVIAPGQLTVQAPAVMHDVAASLSTVAPSALAPGQSLQVNYQVLTTSGYGGNVTTTVYLSTDLAINASDRILAQGTDGLQGSALNASQTVTIPADVAPGAYFVGVGVSVPGDSNAANNFSTALPLTVNAPAQDMIAVTIDTVSPSSVDLQGRLDVSFTLRNLASYSGTVRHRIYLSTDATVDPASDVLVDTGNSALMGGDLSVQRNQLALPAGLTAGSYWVGVEATVLSDSSSVVSNALPLTVTGTPAQQATGMLSANPNPIQVCTGSTGTTTLSWSTTNVTAVDIRVGSPTGSLIVAGGPNGSVSTNGTTANGTVYYLQNVSGGLPLTAQNTLATATVTFTIQGCPSGGGTPPPLTELTEENLNEWNFAATLNGNITTVAGRIGRGPQVKDGEAWIQGSSVTADRLIMSYPRPQALSVDWDLSGRRFLDVWIALVANLTVEAGYPKIVLKSPGGSRTLTLVNPATWGSGTFQLFRIPLGGSADWLVSSQGSFDIQHVTSFDLDFQYESPGISVSIDGLKFVP